MLLVSAAVHLVSLSVDNLQLETEDERPSNDLLGRAWLPGCLNASRALVAFLRGPLLQYAANRSKADSATTSLLSPHLHFGEISVRRVYHDCLRLRQVGRPRGWMDGWVGGWMLRSYGGWPVTFLFL